jgi:hypothetical protein
MEDQEDFDQYEINEVEPGCCGHTLDQCEFIRRRPFSDGEWHEELACPTCGELVCGKQIDEDDLDDDDVDAWWADLARVSRGHITIYVTPGRLALTTMGITAATDLGSMSEFVRALAGCMGELENGFASMRFS